MEAKDTDDIIKTGTPENPSFMADNWLRFVGEKGQRDRKHFLTGVLKLRFTDELSKGTPVKVFDAALGVGTDTFSLLEEGFDVTSNELDESFLRVAKKKASDEGIDLKVTGYDWRDISGIDSDSQDVVLVFGNSLTQLPNPEAFLKALKEFKRILKSEGLLVIDERNYQDMLDRREEILKDPVNNFKIRNKMKPGRATYSEEGIRNIVIGLTNDACNARYYDSDSGRWLSDISQSYPLKRGELKGLIGKAGLKITGEYSDLEEGYDPFADFYQYVCQKT